MTAEKQNTGEAAEVGSSAVCRLTSPQLPAAGPWQQGTPDKEDNYLIKYTTHRQKEETISTGRYLPDHGWLNIFPGMKITAYAEIYE